MAPSALIFDLDGTLWDSFPLYAEIIASAGGPDSAATLTSLLNGASAATLFRQVGVGDRNFAAAATKDISMLNFYPSVKSCLSRLKSTDVPMGIVTSLPYWIWHPLVEMTELSEIISNIEGYRRSSKAAGIKSVISKLSLTANPEVWYVGDLESDRSAAETSGISFAWASWGYGRETPSNTDIILSSFKEVFSL